MQKGQFYGWAHRDSNPEPRDYESHHGPYRLLSVSPVRPRFTGKSTLLRRVVYRLLSPSRAPSVRLLCASESPRYVV